MQAFGFAMGSIGAQTSMSRLSIKCPASRNRENQRLVTAEPVAVQDFSKMSNLWNASQIGIENRKDHHMQLVGLGNTWSLADHAPKMSPDTALVDCIKLMKLFKLTRAWRTVDPCYFTKLLVYKA